MFLRGSTLALAFLALQIVTLSAGRPQSGTVSPDRNNHKAPAHAAQEKLLADEPYVFDRYAVIVRFQNDGTEERELSVRVRVQSNDAAQQFRDLPFRYIAPNEQVSIRSATIRKRDGTTTNILAAPNSTKDSASRVTKDFPAYVSLKEMHLLAPSLAAGDILEYDVVTRIVKPFSPGEFWFDYAFMRDSIALDEQLELDLPSGREFSIRAPDLSRLDGKENRFAGAKLDGSEFVFTQTQRPGRVVLRWTHANPRRISAEEQDARQRGAAPPDVSLTSFEDWNAVARWYAQAEKESSRVDTQIKVKSHELIRAESSDGGKERAICTYVSQKIRDVGLPESLGRMPPRSPEAVLLSGYGTPQEKAALLVALLRAAGIPANAVLIPSRRALDAGLPSPSQFDQAITTFRDGAEPAAIWIDPSAELAPFGFLPATLRGKSALLVTPEGSAKIVKTPADPPFKSKQNVAIEGKLNELGILGGTVRYALRGDTEYVLRTAFHRAPRAEWNELAQTILKLDGLNGNVTNVTISDPVETENPFEVTIAFSDPGAFLWPIQRAKIALPLLTIGMPDPPDRSGQPVKLGSPLDVETRLRLTFPAGFIVHPPAGISVTRDYADFKSSYTLENGALLAERALNFKTSELPAANTSDYLAFMRAVQSDQAQSLLIENPAGTKAEIPSSAATEDLVEAGAAALKAGDARGAIPLLRRATELQPGHKTAWNDLGLAYVQTREFSQAVSAFQKETEVNPSDEHARDYLGMALLEMRRDDDAVAAFRKQIDLRPLDPVAHAQLGSLLLSERRYSEAAPELERAAVLSPKNAELEILLGRAYLNEGDQSKALASFEKAIALSASPEIRNEAAFSLAENGADLTKARQYAESAIRATAAALEKTDLAHVAPADFAQTADIGAYWDTLGWIYFRQGDNARAERYVRAAWLLTQNGEAGDHLAQIYEKSREKERAIHQSALALASERPSADTRARLMLLLGGNSQIDDLVKTARPQLEKLRKFAVRLPVNADASADFLIAMEPGGGERSLQARVTSVRFASGAESLRRFANSLKTIDYGELFPDATPVRLVRRGTLACQAADGECKFTMALPQDSAATK